MLTFLTIFLGCLAIYLLLVAGSGPGATFLTQLFSYEELIAAVLLALLTAVVTRVVIGKAVNDNMLKNPLRLGMFVFYTFTVWLYYLAKANLDVAYRVITGRIRPGIVRIKPGLKTELGRTILANSITLTPGTLTVDLDDKKDELVIHWINVGEYKDEKEKLNGVCGPFADWARRIAE
ncbi:MAG: Na+/H+ antiporter subunit E [Candidatus Thermoplasmatota archaeon]|nr:Na+/H+ antiporter subunit E [Candidatus Thermoplasmatota archaeon]